MVSWAEFAAAEPEFAERLQARFTARRHSTLATLRREGSPRISGTEVAFEDGNLVLGMMPGSMKGRDLRRDARLALHSPTEDTPEADPRSWAGEAKIAGHAIELTDPKRVNNLIAQMFFGLWLLPLGYLVVKSGYFPKALGVLLAIGCFGYLVDLFAHFLAPGIAGSIEPVVLAPAAIGELLFVAWLLVKGIRVPEPKALVPVAA